MLMNPYCCGVNPYPGYGAGPCQPGLYGGCGIPQWPSGGCPGGAPQWPNESCSCSDGQCVSFAPTGTIDYGSYSDHPTRPCCQNGNCSGCSSIGGDAPWLMPKSIGCGRTHKCSFKWKFGLYNKELDNEALPGRPPHTIVCVRASGTSSARVAEEQMTDNPESTDPCDSYDLVLCITVPVEIIVRDCCGYLYCLKSFFSQYVRIPLCAKVRNLKNAQVYVKVRVRLCTPVKVENGGLGDASSMTSDDQDDWSKGCRPDDADMPDGFGDLALPEVSLDILIEACVMRLVPYGVLGADPAGCAQAPTPPYYFGGR